jgi:hypothetical protein
MNQPLRLATLLSLLLATPLAPAQATDNRQPVTLPAPMRAHMLANMRDHLTALAEIQSALAAGKYDQAADVAESRLGMSSLERHGAAHMAGHMPKAMQDIGTAMHRAASRFARTAQGTVVAGDLPRALATLAEVTQQCVACHTGFRLP